MDAKHRLRNTEPVITLKWLRCEQIMCYSYPPIEDWTSELVALVVTKRLFWCSEPFICLPATSWPESHLCDETGHWWVDGTVTLIKSVSTNRVHGAVCPRQIQMDEAVGLGQEQVQVLHRPITEMSQSSDTNNMYSTLTVQSCMCLADQKKTLWIERVFSENIWTNVPNKLCIHSHPPYWYKPKLSMLQKSDYVTGFLVNGQYGQSDQ